MERLFGVLRGLLAPVRGSLYLAVILTGVRHVQNAHARRQRPPTRCIPCIRGRCGD